METDKAVMDVESPVDGVLVSWSGNVDDVLAIGAEIAKVESSEVGASVEAAPSAANTGTAPLYVPQIGEGLQEARIVAFLKQPGETVKRDDPIYQMETDKAVMDVESPYDGTLVSWSAKVDDVVAIGAEVGVMAVAGDTEVAAAPSHGSAPTTTAAPAQSQSSGAQSTGLQGIPPRTRAYAKEKNISDDVLLSIRFSGSKLMPADIDAYLAGSGSNAAKLGYSEKALSSKQRVLNSRMVRSNALVIPGTMTVVASWKPIENERQRN
jgi:pyruvate dehydrogenase E2 component (dihydrolipoamide acetyltransferase)